MKSQKLEQLSIIETSGDDAPSFLQRQLTSDVSKLSSTRAQLAAYLNPKGRVMANFIVLLRDDKYLFVISSELAETLSKRLKLYVLREKVNVEIRTDLAFFGCQQISGIASSDLPQAEMDVQSIDEITIVRMLGSHDRYGILGDSDCFKNSHLAFEPISSDVWNLKDIEAGIPWVTQATNESLLAQAINLDLIDAVSWTKGCYPGQEIVARLHYRGGINRRMIMATSDAESTPTAGDEITCPDLPGNQTGTVVNAQTEGSSNRAKMLVSIPIKFIGQENLLLSNQFPLEQKTESLPYSIPELKGT